MWTTEEVCARSERSMLSIYAHEKSLQWLVTLETILR